MMLKPINASALLRQYGIRPSKRLGQNFLVNPGALERVVDAAGLSGDETVLEIGAGLGALTVRLAREARNVVAVEYDGRLVPILEHALGDRENVDLVIGDILEFDLATLTGNQRYYVVANIPYNITSTLIRRLMETSSQPERVVLTVQREVAERVVAQPGGMNLLALSVQLYGEPEIVASIPAGAFYPVPKVDSAVLRIDIHREPRIEPNLISQVFKLAKAGFGQKRKKLRNALAGGLGVAPVHVEAWLREAQIPPSSRAQELSIEAWEMLSKVTSQWESDGSFAR
jgi:16S rRNA (adenine1518-N6/adenine1519-N6)-dimethyltransferase